MKPLRGGLKLNGKKEASLVTWTIARPAPPRRIHLPLEEPPFSPARPCVRVGDRVRLGEKIAEGDGAEGIDYHAPVSGKVSQIGETLEIFSDGKDEPVPGIGIERRGWGSLSPAEITKIFKESGIRIGKAVPAESPIDTVILNGCESEPYLTSDHSLLMSHPLEILKGGDLLRRALGATDLILALEDNKEEVVEVLKSKIFFHSLSGVRVEMLPARYPQGDERLLIRQRLGRTAGVAVLSITTAYAAYEAVVLQKPFYERVVTIGGECVVQPQNFWLRVGTLVEEAVKYARGFLRPPEKVILGGPMSGRAVDTLEIPILKGTSGILGLPREIAKPQTIEPCIRCNRCVESCPVFISPVMITLAAEKDFFELAQDYGASFCIECGNCSYVCPSKRPMVELIQYVNVH